MEPPLHTRELVVPLPPPDEVTVETGRVYATCDGADLALDVYRPAHGAPGPLPVVLLVHGEPPDDWPDPRSWGQNRSWGRLIAGAGLAGIVFRHRMVFDSGLNAVADDLVEVMRYVIEHADQLGVDPDRLALFGISFGCPSPPPALRCGSRASPASSATTATSTFATTPAPHRPRALRRTRHRWRWRGARRRRRCSWSARAATRPLRNANIDAFVATALAANAALTLVNLPEGTHGFDIADDTPESHDTIAATLAFLRTQLRPASERS